MARALIQKRALEVFVLRVGHSAGPMDGVDRDCGSFVMGSIGKRLTRLTLPVGTDAPLGPALAPATPPVHGRLFSRLVPRKVQREPGANVRPLLQIVGAAPFTARETEGIASGAGQRSTAGQIPHRRFCSLAGRRGDRDVAEGVQGKPPALPRLQTVASPLRSHHGDASRRAGTRLSSRL